MRTPLIAGNWKMNKTLAPARELVAGLREGLDRLGGANDVDVLICPPYPVLFPMAKAIAGSPIMLGAQNCHEAAEGAFTGEVSAPMVKDTGCTFVIVGHSERRQYLKEDGPLLAKKVRAAISAGLNVIYCVGETLDQREKGHTEIIVKRQLNEVVQNDIPAPRLSIAYEPVWAIGTGKTATPQEAHEVHALIRSVLTSVFGRESALEARILYGGSVKPSNALELLSQPDIDGALVGGACLTAPDFLAIIAAAQSATAAKTR